MSMTPLYMIWPVGMRAVGERSWVLSVLREVYEQWRKHDALTLGAALAYYTIFSMAPLLVLVIAIAGLALGQAAAQGEIVTQIGTLVGPSGAKTIEDMIARASRPAAGVLATVVSLVTMALGASGVFGQLQQALNQIWGVTAAAPAGVRGLIRKR